MGTEMIISYDKIGDILTIDQCRPYSGQDEDEIDEGIVVRTNQETGQIENLYLLFFNSRVAKEGTIHLPIDAKIRPSLKRSKPATSGISGNDDPAGG